MKHPVRLHPKNRRQIYKKMSKLTIKSTRTTHMLKKLLLLRPFHKMNVKTIICLLLSIALYGLMDKEDMPVRETSVTCVVETSLLSSAMPSGREANTVEPMAGRVSNAHARRTSASEVILIARPPRKPVSHSFVSLCRNFHLFLPGYEAVPHRLAILGKRII